MNEEPSIEEVLSQETGAADFEALAPSEESPLSLPVLENAIADREAGDLDESESKQPIYDAPEQELSPPKGETEPSEHALPKAIAEAYVDTLLGSANNLIHLGAGRFVSIRAHEDFYEFEELIAVIDEQNQKNIQRLKLDEEDKALLKPILLLLAPKWFKQVSPEKQLMAAVLSILFKKAQIIGQVRAENAALVQKCLEIVQAAKAEAMAEPLTPVDVAPEEANADAEA